MYSNTRGRYSKAPEILIDNQRALSLSNSYHSEHDIGMLLWELSLRHPRDIRNVRIPSPFPALTATCHIQNTVALTVSSTTGNALFILSPYGMTNGSNIFYNLVKIATTYADGVTGAVTFYQKNPFNDSTTPVNNFAFRPVSVVARLIPVGIIDSMKGSVTYGQYPL